MDKTKCSAFCPLFQGQVGRYSSQGVFHFLSCIVSSTWERFMLSLCYLRMYYYAFFTFSSEISQNQSTWSPYRQADKNSSADFGIIISIQRKAATPTHSSSKDTPTRFFSSSSPHSVQLLGTCCFFVILNRSIWIKVCNQYSFWYVQFNHWFFPLLFSSIRSRLMIDNHGGFLSLFFSL